MEGDFNVVVVWSGRINGPFASCSDRSGAGLSVVKVYSGSCLLKPTDRLTSKDWRSVRPESLSSWYWYFGISFVRFS